VKLHSKHTILMIHNFKLNKEVHDLTEQLTITYLIITIIMCLYNSILSQPII